MAIRFLNKTKKEYLVHYKTIQAEVKKDSLLKSYLGFFSKSGRVKGWGYYHGYIQIENKLQDVICKPPEKINDSLYWRKTTFIYTTKVYLFAEKDLYKVGWTEDHLNRLNSILQKYNLSLEKN